MIELEKLSSRMTVVIEGCPHIEPNEYGLVTIGSPSSAWVLLPLISDERLLFLS